MLDIRRQRISSCVSSRIDSSTGLSGKHLPATRTAQSHPESNRAARRPVFVTNPRFIGVDASPAAPLRHPFFS